MLDQVLERVATGMSTAADAAFLKAIIASHERQHKERDVSKLREPKSGDIAVVAACVVAVCAMVVMP